MNPFLHDPVARPVRPRPFVARFAAGPRPSARRALLRAAGGLALAGGLGLATLAPALAAPVDVNTASAEQLEALRGIGPGTARIIIQERARGGPFDSIEDLSDRVRGIGPKRAQALQAAGLVVGEARPQPPAAPPAAGRRPPAK
ncbi:ComEA family DNA-binding protein [Bordetella sp. 2513F-2]